MILRMGKPCAVALSLAVFSWSCATTRPTARKEEPGRTSVLLPETEGSKFHLETVPSMRPPIYPLSSADEYQGRWLTLFEFEYFPPLRPPPAPEDLKEP